MHNLHAGLTGVLAEQRMTERHQQAAHERLLRSARPPRRRRQRVTRRWWQLARWPVGA
jgi:predicted acyl esterase